MTKRFIFIITILCIALMSNACLPTNKGLMYTVHSPHGQKMRGYTEQHTAAEVEAHGWEDKTDAYCINPDAKSKGYVWVLMTYREALTAPMLCCPTALTTVQEERVTITRECEVVGR
jgi:hypothetical protein